jgi:uncharacterized RmlC-like cupin family protein
MQEDGKKTPADRGNGSSASPIVEEDGKAKPSIIAEGSLGTTVMSAGVVVEDCNKQGGAHTKKTDLGSVFLLRGHGHGLTNYIISSHAYIW